MSLITSCLTRGRGWNGRRRRERGDMREGKGRDYVKGGGGNNALDGEIYPSSKKNKYENYRTKSYYYTP